MMIIHYRLLRLEQNNVTDKDKTDNLLKRLEITERGIKYNQDWGYKNGQLTSVEDNFYNKPQISINHYWTINENSSLSTAAYASFGSGGGGGIM